MADLHQLSDEQFVAVAVFQVVQQLVYLSCHRVQIQKLFQTSASMSAPSSIRLCCL
ncbi:hypothetical protein HanRHA438_Chr17g0794641 [Helianthus annuus]|nr:hypothetical protein HanRHA438_Chr17g0794641 [Helianthus annuus]